MCYISTILLNSNIYGHLLTLLIVSYGHLICTTISYRDEYSMYGHYYIHRVWINRIWLPILLVFS